MLIISVLGLSACDARPSTEEGSGVLSAAPLPGEHIVVVANVPGSGSAPPSIEGIVEEIEARGMGVLTLSLPDDGESLAREVVTSVSCLRQDESISEHPVALLAVGHGATRVWQVLAEPPEGLVAAVTVNVPGLPGLDFSGGLAVASLSLNLESDVRASGSHHDVHEAMSEAGTLHQVIVYGGVDADALDEASPSWDAATAHDVALRAADWLQHRDGFTNQNMENPGDHHGSS